MIDQNCAIHSYCRNPVASLAARCTSVEEFGVGVTFLEAFHFSPLLPVCRFLAEE
jgi:hypothetical protein